MGLPAPKLDLLDDAAAAATLMEPTRLRLARALATPDSAAGVARRLGLPRQKVNYHLRELEKVGVVRLVEERKKGNCTERVVQARATHFLVNPDVLGALGEGGGDPADRFSWRYLVAAAARAIRDLAVLRRRADSVGMTLQTLTLETEVRFKNQGDLHAFSEELANEIARLSAKYHDETQSDGRLFRFLVGAYPAITKSEAEAAREAEDSGPSGEGA